MKFKNKKGLELQRKISIAYYLTNWLFFFACLIVGIKIKSIIPMYGCLISGVMVIMFHNNIRYIDTILRLQYKQKAEVE